MGMIVGVFGTDCTNGGISSGVTHVCVMNVDGPFDAGGAAGPPALLVTGPTGIPILVAAAESEDGFGGDGSGWEPLVMPDHAGPMAGGNYATTSDSRWSDAVRNVAYDYMFERGLLSDKVLRHHQPNDRRRGYAIPCPSAVAIHDRFETWAQNDMMSR